MSHTDCNYYYTGASIVRYFGGVCTSLEIQYGIVPSVSHAAPSGARSLQQLSEIIRRAMDGWASDEFLARALGNVLSTRPPPPLLPRPVVIFAVRSAGQRRVLYLRQRRE